MTDDKRKYKRVPLDSILFYMIEDKSLKNPLELLKAETPLSIDISEGGLKFLSLQEIPLKTYLKVIITFYDGSIQPVDIIGRVVWTQLEPISGNYYTGIEFTELGEKQKTVLSEYIDKIEE